MMPTTRPMANRFKRAWTRRIDDSRAKLSRVRAKLKAVLRPIGSSHTEHVARGREYVAKSTDSLSPELSLPTELSLPSDEEAEYYYAGLPSKPRLVARTSTAPWKAPTGPDAQPIVKELQPVYEHLIGKYWESGLATKIHALLDSLMVDWTSTDIVRIGERRPPHHSLDKGGPSAALPIILWIGVVPDSLSRSSGLNAAVRCRGILWEHGIADIDVEIRESVVHRFARGNVGPILLPPINKDDPSAHFREYFATTLGIPIAAKSSPFCEGTGGLFLTEGRDRKRLLLLTARHVVFPPAITSSDSRGKDKGKMKRTHRGNTGVKIDMQNNEYFRHVNNSQPRHEVMLFGEGGFSKYLESLKHEIGNHAESIEFLELSLRRLDRRDGQQDGDFQEIQSDLKEAKDVKKRLDDFYEYVSTRWHTPESRIIGHVVLSPPIMANVPHEGYYEDWAVIEIDETRVNSGNFIGNALRIDSNLDYKSLPDVFTRAFTYPEDRILKFRDIIPEKEMHSLPQPDKDEEARMVVFKRGLASNLTIGRANGIYSYTREQKIISTEWPITSFEATTRPLKPPFSDPGDSGSVVVDGRGRIGALLNGGSGLKETVDITYATPFSFLLRRMREEGLNPNYNPVLTT